jgi:hypothetical protein
MSLQARSLHRLLGRQCLCKQHIKRNLIDTGLTSVRCERGAHLRRCTKGRWSCSIACRRALGGGPPGGTARSRTSGSGPCTSGCAAGSTAAPRPAPRRWRCTAARTGTPSPSSSAPENRPYQRCAQACASWHANRAGIASCCTQRNTTKKRQQRCQGRIHTSSFARMLTFLIMFCRVQGEAIMALRRIDI